MYTLQRSCCATLKPKSVSAEKNIGGQFMMATKWKHFSQDGSEGKMQWQDLYSLGRLWIEHVVAGRIRRAERWSNHFAIHIVKWRDSLVGERGTAQTSPGQKQNKLSNEEAESTENGAHSVQTGSSRYFSTLTFAENPTWKTNKTMLVYSLTSWMFVSDYAGNEQLARGHPINMASHLLSSSSSCKLDWFLRALSLKLNLSFIWIALATRISSSLELSAFLLLRLRRPNELSSRSDPS